MDKFRKIRKYGKLRGRSVPMAVIVAEEVLGRPLPVGAIVHHADGDYTNDAKSNLMILPSKAYHNMIHARMTAIDVCGHADWILCGICKEYDSPENLYVRYKYGQQGWHRHCHAKRELARWRKANGK